MPQVMQSTQAIDHEPNRPDPDQLLAHVQAEEARAKRGRLRIFFGASAGVGKTYAMLEAARERAAAAGTDVVVGYVEPHGRVETERLLEGLASGCPPSRCLPRHRAPRVRSGRRAGAAPGDLLVDELAHSNIVGGEPAPRHPKRWQDVEELLDGRHHVWTTVNVQHLESLNDLVAQITGVRQRETLPDRVFDEADDIELIDLPPDDLLARLHAGKVYIADEAGTAVERFFRTPNLMALRELALTSGGRSSRSGRARSARRSDRARLAGDRVWSPWALMSRRSSSCAPASAWRMPWMPNGRSCTWKPRHCCACPTRIAIGASMCCGWRSPSARRR